MNSDFDDIKGKMRSTWMAGDYSVIARSLEQGAVAFVDRLGIGPGMKVLDLACGDGNLALPAAKQGADVVGLDIAPNLIDNARLRAEREGVTALFEVGDVEAIPFEDKSFDVVMSMFGAMFAPRPEVVAREMTRTCRSGGMIAMANWTRSGFAADVLKIVGRYSPPPDDIPPPVLWGNEENVRERFGQSVAQLELTRRMITFFYGVPPAEVVDYYIQYFGPIKKAFDSLAADEQTTFRSELVELWSANNKADDGTTVVDAEYLEVIARCE